MKPPVILLIVIDSLRADRMSCYGYRLKTTPFLDSILGDFVKFEWAFSSCSYTLPSVVSILTGKYPEEHSLGLYKTSLLFHRKLDSDKDIMIQEVLKANGYKTYAIFGASVLNSSLGIGKGFDKVFECTNRPRRPYYETTDIVTSLIKKEQKPLFIFAHYFDVHSPYIYGAQRNIFHVNNYNNIRLSKEISPKTMSLLIHTVIKNNLDSNFYESCYDSSIALIDEEIKKIITIMKENVVYEDSLLIITADHGELIGEDGLYFIHGVSLHPSLLHVPLLVKFPLIRFEPSFIVNHPISLRDIFHILKQYLYTFPKDRTKVEELLQKIKKYLYAYHPMQQAYIEMDNGDIVITLSLFRNQYRYKFKGINFLYSGHFRNKNKINERKWEFAATPIFCENHSLRSEELRKSAAILYIHHHFIPLFYDIISKFKCLNTYLTLRNLLKKFL